MNLLADASIDRLIGIGWEYLPPADVAAVRDGKACWLP
jgi:hypothetical protein